MPQATSVPPMGPITADSQIQQLNFRKEITIDASLDIVWESVLERHQAGIDANGKPMEWRFEPWPGGRWYRDLGNNSGHLWGHVQVIKPPTLLELCGPMFMSYAATSHIQHRLIPDGDRTTLRLTHTAIGLIAQEHLEGVQMGWGEFLTEIQAAAERRANS